MNNAEAVLVELYLDGGGLLKCPPQLVPPPGKYLQASEINSNATLAALIFSMGAARDGFLAAPTLPVEWTPGTQLHLRGPLGNGFSGMEKVRRLLLVAFENPAHRLLGLIGPALEREAEVVLIAQELGLNVPEAVEIQPLAQLSAAWTWADAIAVDVEREAWPEFLSFLNRENIEPRHVVPVPHSPVVQVLIRAPMPCSAIAECGVCAITLHTRWKMVCKDGPVFDLKDLL